MEQHEDGLTLLPCMKAFCSPKSLLPQMTLQTLLSRLSALPFCGKQPVCGWQQHFKFILHTVSHHCHLFYDNKSHQVTLRISLSALSEAKGKTRSHVSPKTEHSIYIQKLLFRDCFRVRCCLKAL